MTRFLPRLAPAVVVFLMLVPVTNVHAQDASEFGWSVTPYLWATETRVDLTFRDTNIGAGEISFNDLLDVLDARAGTLDGVRRPHLPEDVGYERAPGFRGRFEQQAAVLRRRDRLVAGRRRFELQPLRWAPPVGLRRPVYIPACQ